MAIREMIPARSKHWQRFKRSFGRRWREWRLPPGYVRLGPRYGGWWVNRRLIRPDPLLIDCGLGRDISFDAAFLSRFGGTVIGIDPNPASLAWCREHCPPGMHIHDRAFWSTSGATMTFHLPRPAERLPRGADGVSGSLHASHAYVEGGTAREVTTTSLDEVLAATGRADCDVLKLDIEGAEFEVLGELARSRALARCRQVLVEFHDGITRHGRADTERVVEDVRAAGFTLVHVESRNHIFCRSDLA